MSIALSRSSRSITPTPSAGAETPWLLVVGVLAVALIPVVAGQWRVNQLALRVAEMEAPQPALAPPIGLGAQGRINQLYDRRLSALEKTNTDRHGATQNPWEKELAKLRESVEVVSKQEELTREVDAKLGEDIEQISERVGALEETHASKRLLEGLGKRLEERIESAVGRAVEEATKAADEEQAKLVKMLEEKIAKVDLTERIAALEASDGARAADAEKAAVAARAELADAIKKLSDRLGKRIDQLASKQKASSKRGEAVAALAKRVDSLATSQAELTRSQARIGKLEATVKDLQAELAKLKPTDKK